jgi:hypothetical protein
VIFPSSAVDRGFDPQSGLIKDYKIGICCFFAKYVYTALRRKNKDWLARNQDNVSEWGDMSTRRLLFQWATCSTIKNQLSVLVYYKVDLVIISLMLNLFSPWFWLLFPFWLCNLLTWSLHNVVRTKLYIYVLIILRGGSRDSFDGGGFSLFFQLNHGENKLSINEMMTRSTL